MSERFIADYTDHFVYDTVSKRTLVREDILPLLNSGNELFEAAAAMWNAQNLNEHDVEEVRLFSLLDDCPYAPKGGEAKP
jgi:hypothetical protein